MTAPAIVFYRRDHPSRPLGYMLLRGEGTYVLHAPERELNVYDHPFAHFYHDVHDETEILGTVGLKPVGHRRFAEVTLAVPELTMPSRVRNLRLSNQGRSTADGLIVIDPARQL
jgi:hypothetical protein